MRKGSLGRASEAGIPILEGVVDLGDNWGVQVEVERVGMARGHGLRTAEHLLHVLLRSDRRGRTMRDQVTHRSRGLRTAMSKTRRLGSRGVDSVDDGRHRTSLWPVVRLPLISDHRLGDLDPLFRPADIVEVLELVTWVHAYIINVSRAQCRRKD